MINKHIILFLLVFIALPVFVFSEQAALVLEDINISDETAKEKTVEQIREKLAEELERQDLDYWDESYVASAISGENITPAQYTSQETVISLGQTAGVPVVITVSVQERDALLEIVLTAWDVNGAKQITSERSISKSEVTRYIMINSSITQVVSELTGDYGIELVQEEPKVRKITFISNQEGMKIYLSSGELLGEIVHSVLNVTDLEYEIGTKLLVVKELDGHRKGEQYVFLDREKSAVPLSDLEKAKTLALEMNWTYTQLMGVGTGLRYYAVPDWMYISFDSYFYVQKDFSTPNGNEITHSDMRLLAGLYLGFGPDSFFRVNASLGFGVVLSYPLDRNRFYVDTYINAANVALELNFDDWSFYIRPELRFSLGIGENTLQDGGILLSEYNVPHITLGVLRKW